MWQWLGLAYSGVGCSLVGLVLRGRLALALRLQLHSARLCPVQLGRGRFLGAQFLAGAAWPYAFLFSVPVLCGAGLRLGVFWRLLVLGGMARCCPGGFSAFGLPLFALFQDAASTKGRGGHVFPHGFWWRLIFAGRWRS